MNNRLCTYNSQQSKEDDDGKGKEGDECISMDVWVTVLKNLRQNQSSNDEHEGSIYIHRYRNMKVNVKLLLH